ncbi:MAG TPA: hypothetical protein VHH36_09255, partial [Candidatus Thermoplasmatota archaeon]|nr:hypothetical protein [Candidatus Thermoplasmatota archaeon]
MRSLLLLAVALSIVLSVAPPASARCVTQAGPTREAVEYVGGCRGPEAWEDQQATNAYLLGAAFRAVDASTGDPAALAP